MEFLKVLSLRRRQETDHETGRIGQAVEESLSDPMLDEFLKTPVYRAGVTLLVGGC